MRIILANCPSCEEITAPLGRLSNSSACFSCRHCGDTWTQKVDETLGDCFRIGDEVEILEKLDRSPASRVLGRLLMGKS